MLAVTLAGTAVIAACSVNPATGDRQFTGMLPMANEAAIGAQEHSKIQAQFGNFMTGPVADYVSSIGQKVAQNTERTDVQYRFYTIDSPIVNAFALPGGYIYISRGLLTLANSEAELAAVLGHEIGHVTGRHAAERMSKGTLAGLGTAVLGAAVGGGVAQAASVGANLYLSSYSRSQEHQSDELGVRYLARAGYNPQAMADFLSSLDAQSKLEAKAAGKKAGGANYFSTHPLTTDRVREARAEATKFPAINVENRARYLTQINGLTYGDSSSQGFTRDNRFYHPQMGFTFSYPNGAKVTNGTSQVAINHPNGTVIVFDAAKSSSDPMTFMTREWLKGQNTGTAEAINVNGNRGAMASFSGNVSGRAVTVRLVAVEWQPGQYFRFQMAIPKNVGSSFERELKDTAYSLRRMTSAEKNSVKPKRLIVLTAPAGSTVASMASKMAVDGNKQEYFLVLNGMNASEPVVAGQPYKIVIN